MIGATRPDRIPEPEVDPASGLLVYRMGKLDQFALFPEIPPGAKVTIRIVPSRRAALSLSAVGRKDRGVRETKTQ